MRLFCVAATAPADRAAHDLSERRTAEAADAARQIAEAIGSEVDSFRAAMSGQPLPEPQPQPETTNAAPAEQPQPEAPLDNGIDSELQRALENPKIRALLEHEAQTAQLVQQRYAQATQEAAQIAAASVYAAFPELQGLNGDQLAGAIHAIGRQNPTRAAEIRNHIKRVRHLVGTAAQAQAQQQQRAANETGRLKVFSNLLDWFDEFRLYHRKGEKIVKKGEDLMAATRYGIMMSRFARTKASHDSFHRKLEYPEWGVA